MSDKPHGSLVKTSDPSGSSEEGKIVGDSQSFGNKATKEGKEEFNDLFFDRRKSVRSILEDTFQDEMLNVEVETQEVPQSSIPIRFRHPPIAGPVHDVFGDAVHAIFQKLMSKGQPAEYCHWMSHLIASHIDTKFKPNDICYKDINFHPDQYVTDGTIEAKKIFADNIWPVVNEILRKTKDTCEELNEKWTGIHVSADQMKGHRHKQEDRFVAYPNGLYMNREEDPISLLAVFDGHGGSECSQYAAAHFWEEWLKIRRQHQSDPLENQLQRSLELLDVRMTVRSEKECWKGGTTAVCCAIDIENKNIAFAWLGDSPGYIMSNLAFRKVTREHSPCDPIEARRVEEAGGQLFVIGGELRVNGVINLTRSLGDIPGRPMISNEPEVTSIAIDPADYLVLLACDGISDVFNTDGLYQLVEAFISENPVEEYSDLARYICSEAISAGSADNVSVVIGFLRPPQDLWRAMDSDDEDNEESEDKNA